MTRKVVPNRLAGCALLFALLLTVSPRLHAAATTLENLQAAFNGESNARHRYLAFAAKADSEHFGQVASLFRAAARAEEVHAANHAQVIKQLGGTPKATIENPEVKTTAENLQAAIKGETYERDSMYPEFLKKARADGNRAAIRTLNLARLAEAEHAKLYTQVLQGLQGLKQSGNKSFYVCPVCGFTTTDPSFTRCPSCFTAKERFEKIA